MGSIISQWLDNTYLYHWRHRLCLFFINIGTETILVNLHSYTPSLLREKWRETLYVIRSDLKMLAIGRTAVRETGISRHQGEPPINPSDHHSTIVLRGLRGILNGAPLCWERLASRRADVTFFNMALNRSESELVQICCGWLSKKNSPKRASRKSAWNSAKFPKVGPRHINRETCDDTNCWLICLRTTAVSNSIVYIYIYTFQKTEIYIYIFPKTAIWNSIVYM